MGVECFVTWLVWEHLRILPEELEEVSGGEGGLGVPAQTAVPVAFAGYHESSHKCTQCPDLCFLFRLNIFTTIIQSGPEHSLVYSFAGSLHVSPARYCI